MEASKTSQRSVAAPPGAITCGSAEKTMVGGGAIVTVASAVRVPPAPLAVSMYVVVLCGRTSIEPFSGIAPIPLSMLAAVALEMAHESVAASPSPMIPGVAMKEICGAFGALTVIVLAAVAMPPGPVAVSV